MNIAVVGGGRRCKRLMDLIENHTFYRISPKVVAVADPRPDAMGAVEARKKGLFVTTDYNDFFERDDIDLIVELVGDMDIYNDILKKKKNTVRAIANTTATLFWEISRVSRMQQETRQKLMETRALYKVLVDQLIQEDVLVIASDYRVLDINKTLLDKIGLERHEAIGRFCYQLTHHQNIPCSGDLHPCPLVNTLETRRPFQATHVHYDKDSRELHYSISCYPLFEGDELVGAIEISRDITKDINLQKSMMQQEKLASIGRLSAGVAHEINNPLTTILTTAMLLQEETAPEDPAYEELETIARETLRCRKIVTSLLDFARQSRPNKHHQDINAVVGESLLLTKKQAAFHDVSIEKRLAEGLPPLDVDKGQIQQSIINLVLNAVEATPPGGRVTVETRLSDDGLAVEICVGDTGCGIDKENLGRVFDPFFTTKESGTGLGLALTHGIIEQHGGTIDVESIKGRGTLFTISLPLPGGEEDAR